jgi:hypothetical protein
MPIPNVIPKVLLPDAAMNRFADQLMAVLNPILRNVNGDLKGPVAAPSVVGWLGKPLDPLMATPVVDQVPKWNGSAWVPGVAGTAGAVTAVTATGPLASSGGTTPDISLTGIVPIANGGTNTSTLGAAGSVPYSTGTAYAFGLVGSAGQVYTSQGASAPTWQTPTSSFTGASIGSYRATTTTPDTIALTDYTVDVTTTGAFVVNLPTAGSGAGQAAVGRVFIVKNTGGATITVTPAGAQTIDGASTFVVQTKYASFTFQSTGSGWVLL